MHLFLVRSASIRLSKKLTSGDRNLANAILSWSNNHCKMFWNSCSQHTLFKKTLLFSRFLKAFYKKSFPTPVGWFYFLLHIAVTITYCKSLTSDVGGWAKFYNAEKHSKNWPQIRGSALDGHLTPLILIVSVIIVGLMTGWPGEFVKKSPKQNVAQPMFFVIIKTSSMPSKKEAKNV
jgi:hypothetical protein